ncbi:MAG: type II toxin-antitoxin system RelE/ParE family toxin [Chloroflexi bacterium]|nr:type II toxin-antitoxin system RelE/ParE family toxin [Chloroflexota bacterium]
MNRFRDRDTERLFNGEYIRRLPPHIQQRARQKVRLVIQATRLADLQLPRSNRLEPLRGDRAGQHSIRINNQWRICFQWTQSGAFEVEVTDYH